MRKILAGFMATAMVTSICATASMAASKSAAHEFTVISGIAATTSYDQLIFIIDEDNSDAEAAQEIILPINYTTDGSPSDATVAKEISGSTFHSVEFNGKIYNVTLKLDPSASTKVIATFSPAADLQADNRNGYNFDNAEIGLALHKVGDPETTRVRVVDADHVVTFAKVDMGSGTETADKETSGSFTRDNVKASEVLKAYGDGTPIPLTENAIGVDKDLNDKGGVQSNQTVYFMVRSDVVTKLDDSDYWKLKITKGENGKYIDAVSDVTKIFSGNLYDANTGAPVEGTGNNIRRRYIKVALNEIYTDDEYKIGLDMRLSATSKAVNTNIATDDSEIKVKDFTFYMKNIVKAADNDWKVGINGLMLNPLTNDWNTVTYYDEDGDVASLKFFADSDTGKFYSKLSTKWAHEDYAAYFNDQDAFYFEFTGSPKLSSTSRADLQIYNPFVDEDGNETIDPSTATIYQVVDGDLIDVTESFTYGEGENGDDAFITRTRFLGQYIICEKPVEEATGDADIDDLMPDDMETPDDVTPDAGNNGGKAPANTGRYL